MCKVAHSNNVMKYFPPECACSRGFFIVALYREVIVNRFNSHSDHVRHLLTGCAVREHPSAAFHDLCSHYSPAPPMRPNYLATDV
ncbi:Uncharacterised protein [Klebsiella pneumoniae]|nr:Uncharacterised protein [Klebsiella pneumoniae]